MEYIEDKYQGVIVKTESLPDRVELFTEQLHQLLNQLTNKKLIWIKVPQHLSAFIPILTELDFNFHHCAEHSLMLVKKLVNNPIIPNAKNYNVGVGALVINGNKLLVIKDRFNPGYKFPGGHIDPDETIELALQREVMEETGVTVKFQGIVNIGHFLKGQFGEQHLYFICLAEAITHQINVLDASEIVEAKWLEVDEFLNDEQVNPYNKSVLQKVISSAYAQLELHPVKLRSRGEIFL